MALVPTTNLSRIRDNARRFALGFTTGQKFGIVVAIVGIVVGLGIFMSLSGKPSYSPLFTNLQSTDAAAITQKLTADHVTYQLQDGGATILVPQNSVDQERLAMAAASLPSQGNVGLSILDKEGLTTSQLTQQADYLQGLQGELQQTINSISGVTSSRVLIAMPANQTFALGTNNPTGASVIVGLSPNHSLTYTQVASITNLVASAVPGLTTNQVTVADSSGNLLAGPGVNDTGALQNGAEQNYDAGLESRIQTYLTGILGSGNSQVSVNAQLNFDQVHTSTQTLITGANGKLATFCTNTQTSTTKYAGTGTPAGVTVTTIAGNGNYTQNSSTKTCETGQQTQDITQSPGAVKSQAVAVVVNSASLPRGLTMARLQQGVSAAAGIQASRGDILSFSSAVFKSVPTAASSPKTSALTSMTKPAIALVILLLFLFMLYKSSRKARRSALAPGTELSLFSPEQLRALGMFDDVPRTDEVPIITQNHAAAIAKFDDLISGSPEDVAVVLRSMMSERA
ncbi:MAG TPA: flagellar basal-body MS-ring/collar protein FliF [Acidimicrobiales bacterium]|jgi:flagellar M-ring protein FliF|nr:flagellar basal-body MS-ring/collar protein FliF [Acidimicrobiales bacterium]